MCTESSNRHYVTLFDDPSLPSSTPNEVPLSEPADNFQLLKVYGVDIDWHRCYSELNLRSYDTAWCVLFSYYGDANGMNIKTTAYQLNAEGTRMIPMQYNQVLFENSGGVTVQNGVGVSVSKVLGLKL